MTDASARTEATTREGHLPNRVIHTVSLSATKVSDGLADAKLVLSWLLGALGAPGWMLGFLVPIREAGALLPQILMAPRVARTRHRKWWWAAGSAIQGLAVLGMALSALTLDGASAGAAVLGLLSVAALARAACSVSFKDVLGKTVDKGARGSVTGTAASLSAGAVLLFAGLLLTGAVERSVATVAGALVIAGGLWLLAAALFSRLAEPASEDGGATPEPVSAQFAHLRRDPQLRAFLAARGFLTATALAPPFLVAVAGAGAGFDFGAFGPFLLASAAAGLVSGRVWGLLSDRSSRDVMALAGALAGAVLLVMALAGPMLGGYPVIVALALFVLMIAHQGVRTSRSTHLVDMAPAEHRAAYSAVANTTIGVLLLLGGGAGAAAASAFGPAAVLGLFAAMAFAGAVVARALLRDVQAG